MSSTVKVRKRRSFSAIPDDILEDTRMRTETRFVLGYLIGRPDGWEVRPGHIQRMLGISRDRWSKAKQEMERYGYLKQSRRQQADGKFVWEHIVSDMPMERDETIAGKSSNGKTSAGEPGDITTSSYQDHLNTPSPYPFPESPRITQACVDEARERFQGYSIETLEVEWRRAITEKGEHPRNPDRAFLGWASVYAKNHPLPYGGGF